MPAKVEGNWKMPKKILILFCLLSLAACSPKVKEQDGGELTSLMEEISTSIRTKGDLRTDVKSMLRNLIDRIGYTNLVTIFTPPKIVRTNPSVHVHYVTVQAWYDLKGKLYRTTWPFRKMEGASEWTLSCPAVKAMEYYDFIYHPGDLLTGLLGKMSTSEQSHLSDTMKWEPSADPLPILERAFLAQVNSDGETFSSLTADGALLHAHDKGADINRLVRLTLPDREYDRAMSVDFLKEQIDGTRYIMDYCEAKAGDVLPYIRAYNIASMPEHCSKVRLEIKFEKHEKQRILYVGNRVILGFVVDWTAARIADKWVVESLLIDCIVTDTAKRRYERSRSYDQQP